MSWTREPNGPRDRLERLTRGGQEAESPLDPELLQMLARCLPRLPPEPADQTEPRDAFALGKFQQRRWSMEIARHVVADAVGKRRGFSQREPAMFGKGRGPERLQQPPVGGGGGGTQLPHPAEQHQQSAGGVKGPERIATQVGVLLLPLDGIEPCVEVAMQQRRGGPAFAVRAKGAYFRDVDGRQYLDYLLSYGPIILGHCDPDVNEAVRRQMEEGWLFSIEHPSVIEFDEALSSGRDNRRTMEIEEART